jgi:hypothetical protein
MAAAELNGRAAAISLPSLLKARNAVALRTGDRPIAEELANSHGITLHCGI